MTDSTEDIPTLASNIKLGIESYMKDMHTALPGFIESFDPNTQLATIQPAIKRIFISTDGDTESLTEVDLPLLINVPIVFPRGGGFSLTFPIKLGDECLLIFNERSIDLWHEQGGVRRPGAKRFHSLSDAVALVGLSSKQNKVPVYNNEGIELKADDDSAIVEILPNEINVTADNVINLTAPAVNINADTISLNGDVESIGTFTNNGVNISSTHVHPQGADSDGNSQVPTDPPQ